MSLDCLTNFIGVRQACENGSDVPLSGLYIDDLEGISIKNLAQWESGKYNNAIKMIDVKIESAIKEVFEESKMYFSDKFIVNSALDTSWAGSFNDDYHANEAVEKGLRFNLLKTPLKCLKVHTITVKVKEDVTEKELKIIDGDVTKTVLVTALAGVETEICFPYTSMNGCIDIVWDTSDIEPADGDTQATYFFRACDSCGSQQKYSEYVIARGLNNGKEDGRAYGISAQVTVECCMDKAMCLIAHNLKYSILYKTGIKLLKEAQINDRLNFIAIHSPEWLSDKIDEWEQVNYREKFKYEVKALRNFVKRLDRDCFECNGYKHGYAHP